MLGINNSNTKTGLSWALLVWLMLLGMSPLQAQSIVPSGSTSGCSPLLVTYSATPASGKTISSYNWNLGNGNTSTDPNPGGIYSTAGSYTVSVVLQYTDGSSSNVTLGSSIVVFPDPVPTFTASSTGVCAGTPVEFTNTTASGPEPGTQPYQQIEWEFLNDGSIVGNASGANPTFTFTADGQYDVSLLVMDDNGCSNTTTINDFITVVGEVNAAFTPSTPIQTCENSVTVSFANSSNTTATTGALEYLWDFGDGNTSTQTNPTHTFAGTGSYNVSLTATHNLTGCSDQMQIDGFVQIIDHQVSFSSTQQTTCNPIRVRFENTSTYTPATPSGLTYLWDFGDGNTSTQQNPTYEYTTPGTYSVTFTVAGANGCGGSVTQTNLVTVPPAVVADFTPDETNFCEEDFTVNFADNSTNAVSWAWDFGDGATSTAQNPSHAYSGYGTYDVELTVTDAAGCTDTETVAIVAEPVQVDFTGSPLEGCTPMDVSLFDQTVSSSDPIASWSWEVVNATTSATVFTSSAQNPTFNIAEAGIFDVTLTVTTASGCTGTLTQDAMIRTGLPPISMDFLPNRRDICNGDVVLFDNLSVLDPSNPFPVEWTWDYEYNSGAQIPAVNAEGDGQHQYDEIDSMSMDVMLYYYSNGCIQEYLLEDTVVINWPVARFTVAQPQCAPDSVYLTNEAGGYTSFLWNFFDDQGNLIGTTSAVESPALSLPTNSTYTIQLIAFNDTVLGGNGCVDTTEQVVVTPEAFEVLEATASVDTSCVDQSVTFATAFVADSYTWTLNSPSGTFLSDQQTFEREFGTPGTRVVYLTTNFSGGCTQADSVEVTIIGPDNIPTSDVQNGCVPLTVVFTDSSTSADPITFRSWSLDGVQIGDVNTFTHVFDSAKSPQSEPYAVRLILEDANGCRVSRRIDILATDPAPDFRFSLDTTCSGIDVVLRGTLVDSTGLEPLTYSWTTNAPGITIDNGRVRTAENFPEGTFDVQLLLTDSIGCQDSITKQVAVGSIDTMQLNFVADTTFKECPPVAVTFTDLTAPGEAGLASWLWEFGDGTTSELQNPTRIYRNPGTYTVTLTVTDSIGCVSTFQRIDYIQLNGPFADMAVDDTVGYVNFAVDFSSTVAPPDSITWDFGDGTLAGYLPADNSDFTYIYDTPGDYTVNMILKDTFGCTWSPSPAPYTVHALPCPEIELPEDVTTCLGATVMLSAYNSSQDTIHPFPISSTVLYRWWEGDDASGTPDGTGVEYPFTATAVGTHTVIAQIYINDDGVEVCMAYDTMQVIVDETPTADFASDSPGCLGTPIQFTDSSVGGGANTIVARLWNFGDGSVSTSTNPSRTYAASGNYDVTLIVTSSNGCRDTLTQQVSVSPSPELFFRADTVCAGQATSFRAFATVDGTAGDAVNSRRWDFDNDGDFGDATGVSVTHTFTAGGTYRVGLLASTNNGCADTVYQDVLVNPGAVGALAVDPACFQYPSAMDASGISVVSGSIVEYQWDFQNDGTIDEVGTSDATSHTYANYPAPGADSVVSLTVITSAGCAETFLDTAAIRPNATAAFAVDNVCFSTNTLFTNNTAAPLYGASITRYRLDYTNNGGYDYDNPNFTTASFRYPSVGNYTALLEVTTTTAEGEVCTDTATVPLTIQPLPAAAVSIANRICAGESTELSFQFTAGLPPYDLTYTDGTSSFTLSGVTGDTSFLVSPTASPTTYTITALVDANGCEQRRDFDNATIFVDEIPLGGLQEDATICEGVSAELLFKLPTSGTYDVVYTDGTSQFTLAGIANEHIELVSPAITTTYSLVSVENTATGCVRTSGFLSDATITVNPSPVLVLQGDDVICEGESVTLTFDFTAGTAPFEVTIEGDEVINLTGVEDGDQITLSPTVTTTYQIVSVRDANGCVNTGSGSFTIEVSPAPAAALSGSTTICLGASADLTFTASAGTAPFEATLTETTTGNTLVFSNLTGNDIISVSPTATTDYVLTALTDANGCSGSSLGNAVTVQVIGVTASISGPAESCVGQDLTFVLDVPNTLPYTVAISDGTSSFTFNSVSDGDELVLPALLEGNITYTLTSVLDETTGCVATDLGSVQVLVHPRPAVDLTASAESSCLNGSVTLTFGLGNDGPYNVVYTDGTSTFTLNGILDSHTVEVSPAVPTTYTVVSVENVHGCVQDVSTDATASTTVQVGEVPAVSLAKGPDPICVGESTTLTFTLTAGSLPYDLVYTDGTNTFNLVGINEAETTVTVDPSVTTTYEVTFLSAQGCEASASDLPQVTVAVNPLPIAVFGPDQAICEGDEAILTLTLQTGTAPFTVEYTDGTSTQTLTASGTETTLSVTPSENTTYQLLRVVDANGCESTEGLDQVVVTVNPLPNGGLAVLDNSTICAGESTTLVLQLPDTDGPFDVEYTDGTNAFTLSGVSDGHTFPVSPAATTTYAITSLASTANGCGRADGFLAEATVTVNPIPVIVLESDVSICNTTIDPVTLTFRVQAGTGPFTVNVAENGVETITGLSVTDGTTISVNPAETTVYSIVSIIDQATNCTSDGGSTATITIGEVPNAALSASDPQVCEGEQVSIVFTSDAPGNGPFDITFTDGTTTATLSGVASGDAIATFVGTADVTYTLLQVVDATGCTRGGDFAAAASVDVQEAPEVVSLTGTSPICDGETATLELLLSAVESSSFDVVLEVYENGALVGTLERNGLSASASISVNPTVTTTYTVRSAVGSNGCAALTVGQSATIEVNPVPVVAVTAGEACFGTATAFDASASTIASGSIVEYAWDFDGDGAVDATTATATTQHLYAASGTYAAQVTGTSDDGCAATATVTVTVLPTAVPSFAASNACALEGVVFENTTAVEAGATAVSYGWDFDYDGIFTANTVVADQSDVSHNYSTPGTYTVALQVTLDNGCTVLATQDVTVGTTASADLSASAAAICEGESAVLTFTFTQGTAPFTVQYSDGTSTQTLTATAGTATVDIFPAETTTYTLVSVADANGCEQQGGFDAVTVFVNELPNGSISPDAAICAGGSAELIFNLPTSGTYNVVYTDGTSTFTLSGIENEHVELASPAATATYALVSIENAATGCRRDSDFLGSATVTVNPLPNIDLQADATICEGGEAQLTFRFTAGTAPFEVTIQGDETINFTGLSDGDVQTVSPVATTTYQVVSVRDANGCERLSGFDHEAVTISVSPIPTGAISGNAAICEGGTVELAFEASGIAPFQATITETATGRVLVFGGLEASDVISVSPDASTDYVLTALADANGCAATAVGSTVSVEVLDLSASITASSEACLGDDIVFTFQGFPNTLGYTAVISDGTTDYTFTGVSNNSQVTIPATATGLNTFTLVSVLDETNGCSASGLGSVTVAVRALPTATLTASASESCAGGSVTLTFGLGADGPYNVTYTDGTETFLLSGIFDGHTETVLPAAATTYTIVSVENAFGCSQDVSAEADASVTVQPSEVPAVTIVKGADPVCVGGSTTLTFTLTAGTLPYDLIYTDGANTFNLLGIDEASVAVTVAPSANTTYTVTYLASSAGCEAPASGLPSETISVRPLPVVAVGPDQTICEGETAELTFTAAVGTAPFTVTYTDGTTTETLTIDGTAASISVSPEVNTAYRILSIADANGCTRTEGLDQAVVTVDALPNGEISVLGNSTICEGESTTITFLLPDTDGPFDVQYTDGTDVFTLSGISDEHVLEVSPSATTTYSLMGISSTSNDCERLGGFLGEATVTVNPAPAIVLEGTASLCNSDGATVPLTFSVQSGTGPFLVNMAENGVETIIGLTVTDGLVLMVNPSETTTYTITSILDQATNCTSDGGASVTITLGEVPNASLVASNGGTACEGSETTIAFVSEAPGNGPFDIVFTDGTETFSLSGVNSGDVVATITPTVPVTYTLLSVSDALGCERTGDFTAAAEVEISGAPSVLSFALSSPSPVCGTQEATLQLSLSSGGASSFDVVLEVYENGVLSGTISETGLAANAAISVTPSVTTTYVLQSVTAANGCAAVNVGQSVEVEVNPVPVAAVTTESVCLGEAVVLDASASSIASGSIASYGWDFDGDGNVDETTTAATVSHLYDAPGTYTVLVTATSDAGCEATASVAVEVLPSATASFTAAGACGSSEITFQNTTAVPDGATVLAYAWDFEFDGTFEADVVVTDQTALSHDYGVPGSYTAALQVTLDNGCSVLATQTVAIGTVPNASISVDQAVICEGAALAVTISITEGIAPYTIIYSINGEEATLETAETETVLTLAPAENTTYTLVSVTDAGGCTRTDGFVQGEASVEVTPSNNAGIAVVEEEVCLGEPVTLVFTLPTLGSHSVVFSGGGIVEQRVDGLVNGATITVIPTEVGEATFALDIFYDAITGCVRTENFLSDDQVTVHALPTASLSADASAVCLGESTSVRIALTGAAPFTVEYLENGVARTATANSNELVLELTPSVATTISLVQVSDANGCVQAASGEVTVDVQELPAVALSLSGEGTICAGGSTELTFTLTQGTAPFTVTYTDGTETFTLTSDATSATISVSPESSATYSVVGVEDANGCSGAGDSEAGSEVTVQVNVLPLAAIGTDATICLGETATLTVSLTQGTAPFTATYTDGSSVFSVSSEENALSFEVSPEATTTYTLLSVSDANGCATSSGLASQAVVTVNTPPASAALAVLGNSTICQGETAALQFELPAVGGPFNVVYSDGTGEILLSGIANGHEEPVSPASTTTYTIVSVEDVNEGCVSDSDFGASATVTVNPTPSLALLGGDVTVCNAGTDNTVQLTVQVLAGTGPFRINVAENGVETLIGLVVIDGQTIPASPSVTTTYTITRIVDLGATPSCEATGDLFSTTITLSESPNASLAASNGGAACEGTQVDITFVSEAPGNGPFDIVFTDGTETFTLEGINSGDVVASFTASADVTYTLVSVSDANGCDRDGGFAGAASVSVEEVPAVTGFSLSSASPICAGDAAVLSLEISSTASSSFDVVLEVYENGVLTGTLEQLGLPANATISVTPGVTTTYVVQSVTADNGCSAASAGQSVEVEVNPIPSMSATAGSACLGEAVSFDASASGIASGSIASYGWDFDGDGTIDETTSSPTVSHLYEASGSYTVLVTGTSDAGCTATASVGVEVAPNAVAGFTAGNACVLEDVVFTNTTVLPGDASAVSFAWDFDYNGTFGANAETSTPDNQVRQYAVAGTYTVALLVTMDNGCTSLFTQEVVVGDRPDASLSAVSTVVCEGGTAVLEFDISGGVAPYEVVFTANGVASSVTVEGSTGSLEVVLTEDTDFALVSVADAGGCVRTGGFAQGTVSVAVNALRNASIAVLEEAVCLGSPVTLQFALPSTGTYDVVFSGAGFAQVLLEGIANGHEQVVTPSEAGTWLFELNSVSDAVTGCVRTEGFLGNDEVVVHALPTAAISADASAVCLGGSTSVRIALTGTAPFAVEYLENGVAQTATANSNELVLELTPSVATTISLVQVSDANGCVQAASGEVTVDVQELPAVALSLSGEGTICAGGGTELAFTLTQGTAPFTVVYTDGTETFTLESETATATVPVSPSGLTTYSVVSVTDANGCAGAGDSEAGSEVTVGEFESPLAVLSGDAEVCAGESAVLTFTLTQGTAPFTVVYSDGASEFSLSSETETATAEVSPASSTTYTLVSVTDANGCTVSEGLSSQAVVTVNAYPVGGRLVSQSDLSICAGESVELVFDLPDDGGPFNVVYSDGASEVLLEGIADLHVETVSPSADAVYTLVSIADVDAPACVTASGFEGSVAVTVAPAPAGHLEGDFALCDGGTASLTLRITAGTGPFRVTIAENGTASFTLASAVDGTAILVSPSATTTYSIVSIVDLGSAQQCAYTNPDPSAAEATITIGDAPNASLVASNGGAACEGTQVDITFVSEAPGNGPFDIIFTDGTETFTLEGINSGDVVASFTASADVTYTLVSVSDAFGCERDGDFAGAASVSVEEVPAVTSFSLSSASPICAGETAVLSLEISSTASSSFDVVLEVYENGVLTGTLEQPGLPANSTIEVTPSVTTPGATTTYVVQSVTADNGCSAASAGQSVEVEVNPIPSMSATAGNACLGEAVSFDASASAIASGSIASYGWDFDGDGTIDETTSSPTVSHLYEASGSYTVLVTGTSDAGCTATASVGVEVAPNAVAGFTIASVCASTAISLQNITEVPDGITVQSYAWDFDFAGTFEADVVVTDQSAQTHDYGALGTYTVALQVMSDNGCVSLFTQEVVLGDLPNGILNITADVQCVGESTPLNLIVSAGVSPFTVVYTNGSETFTATLDGNGSLPTPAVEQAGTVTYTMLSIADASGCVRTDGFSGASASIVANPSPEVAFDIASTCAGEVVLTDASTLPAGTSAVQYAWDVDGDGSFEQSGASLTTVSATLAEGSYTATLRITLNNGCAASFSQALEVVSPPAVSLAGPGTACDGETVDFTASIAPEGTSIGSFSWTVNGVPVAGNNSATLSAALTSASGNFEVQEVAVSATTADGCVVTATISVTVAPAPAVTLVGGGTTICQGETANLTFAFSSAYAGELLDVTFSDGTSTQTLTGIRNGHVLPVTPSESTNYTIVSASSSGCASSTGGSMYEVTVNPAPQVAFVATTTCAVGALFEDVSELPEGTAAVSYAWFVNGRLAVEGADQTSFSPNRPAGVYDIGLRVLLDNGCQAEIVREVTLTAPPTVLLAGPNVVCSGESAVFTANILPTATNLASVSWTVNGVPVQGADAAVLTTTLTASGAIETASVVVTVVTAEGCETSTAFQTRVEPLPTASFASDALTICEGQEASMPIAFGGAYAGEQLTVTISDGTDETVLRNISDGHVFTASPTANTTYTIVAVSTANGCAAVPSGASIPVSVIDMPELEEEYVVCRNSEEALVVDATVSLPGGGITPRYQWSKDGRALQGETGSSLEISLGLEEESATYSVAISGILCPTTYTFLVRGTLPPADLIADAEITSCLDSGSIVLNPEPIAGYSYLWAFPDGSETTRPSLSVFRGNFVDEEGDRLDVGTVHVLITDDATGCYTRDSVTIFDECPAIVALPNAFTPNGDGNNDIFRPVRPMDDTTPNDVGESMNIRNYQLRIYNRWGEVIYAEEGSRSEDVVGWDGTYLGQMMPSGTYAWVFVYTDEFSGLEYTMEGNVTLLK